jgi:hypothetical protein
MKIDIGKLYLADKFMDREINQMLDITGVTEWRQKIAKYGAQSKGSKNVFKSMYAEKRHPLLYAVDDFLRLRDTGMVAYRNQTPRLIQLASVAKMFNIFHNRLTTAGRREFASRLKGDISAKSLMLEMLTATHLHIRDFDVDYVDWNHPDKQARTHDFSVEHNGIAVDVECKFVEVDTGRPIAAQDFAGLCDGLRKCAGLLNGDYIVRIVCDRGLREEQTNSSLARTLCSRLQDDLMGRFREGTQDIFIQRNDKPFDLSDEAEVMEALECFYVPGGRAAAMPLNVGSMIVTMESRRPSKKLRKIYDGLKQGAGQLPSEHPGILVTMIEGLDADKLQWIGRKGGLSAVARRLFSSSARDHIAGVCFLSESQLKESLAGVYGFVHDVLRYTNENCRFHLPSGLLKDFFPK